jgi:heme-degrading monooxygenase HmoA
MDGVINSRTVPVFPGANGNRQNPAEEQVCAIILAVRSNHPLGIFASGYEEVGNYFSNMMKQLEKQSTEYGFLGASSWLSTADRGVSSEYMTIIYFDSLESLHAYAHGPLHTEAMNWWSKTEHKLPHIGIMHEVFAAPKNSWEGIYVNYHPTGLGATRKEVSVGGEKVWMNPLVKGRGRLTYSKGRMGRPYSSEKEWVALEKTLTTDEMAGEKA